MKRLGDWEYVLGINVMNQHLSFGTITGARKYDYPQSFSYHEPWWNHYGVLAAYFARLSLALVLRRRSQPHPRDRADHLGLDVRRSAGRTRA